MSTVELWTSSGASVADSRTCSSSMVELLTVVYVGAAASATACFCSAPAPVLPMALKASALGWPTASKNNRRCILTTAFEIHNLSPKITDCLSQLNHSKMYSDAALTSLLPSGIDKSDFQTFRNDDPYIGELDARANQTCVHESHTTRATQATLL